MPPKKETFEEDAIWKALADPTRRGILDLLRDGPQTTTTVVEAFPELTRFGVMKHLEVLRESSLVQTRAEGRQRLNSLNAAPLREIVERWINQYDGFWANTMLRVKGDAQSGVHKQGKSKRKA